MKTGILLTFLLGVLLPATAHAAPKKPTEAELDAFIGLIAKCWDVPRRDANREFLASIEVEIDPKGQIKTMKVVEKSEPSQPKFVASIKKAITKCSPYKSAPDNKFIVSFHLP